MEVTSWYNKDSVILFILAEVGSLFEFQQMWSLSQRYEDRDLPSLTVFKGIWLVDWETCQGFSVYCVPSGVALFCSREGSLYQGHSVARSAAYNTLHLQETILAWSLQSCIHSPSLPPPCPSLTPQILLLVSWNVSLDLIISPSGYA